MREMEGKEPLVIIPAVDVGSRESREAKFEVEVEKQVVMFLTVGHWNWVEA